MRSRETLRPLLLLDLFAEGTNTGIKRVATANPHYGYDELLYVRKHYISVEALRNANGRGQQDLGPAEPAAVGEGHACASDGKRFESWRQNLMTEWRSRCSKAMASWSTGMWRPMPSVYSQLRNPFSEVAAMIEGLVRHDTEMRVEKTLWILMASPRWRLRSVLLGGVRLMPLPEAPQVRAALSARQGHGRYVP